MKTTRKTILFLGNTPNKEKRSIGGATILTKYILDELLNDKGYNVVILNTRKRWYKFGQIIDFPLLILKLPFYFKNKDVVSIHASWDFHLTIGPFVYILSKMFNKKVVYHFFGGNFHDQFRSFSKLIQWWLKKTILSADYKLMETKKMINYFQTHKGICNLIWFPNARKSEGSFVLNLEYKRRFVFVSRVTKTKGIDLLFQVADKLGELYTIDVFGPLDNRFYTKSSFKGSKLRYQGLLMPQEVNAKLQEYDIIVLPTYYKGEGYPGVLIEAMSLGKPILTTEINALDEIVTHGFNGLLVKKQSVDELYNGIVHFNENNYKNFVLNSINQFKEFDIENVIEKLKNTY